MLFAVVPIYNEEQNIPGLYSRLTNVLQNPSIDNEVIFVDDGSREIPVKLMKFVYPHVVYADGIPIRIDAGPRDPPTNEQLCSLGRHTDSQRSESLPRVIPDLIARLRTFGYLRVDSDRK